jgi:hypothetical protein
LERIVAIGTAAAPLDFQMACLGTFSKCVKDGSEVTVIMATERKPETDNHHQGAQDHIGQNDRTVTMMQQAELLLERLVGESWRSIGISQVLIAEGIDHSVVTQSNVEVFRSQIESLNPTLAVIPYYRSCNLNSQIIGRSALLACRWVQNVLMYDSDAGGQSPFRPSIFSKLSPEQHEKKKTSVSDLAERISRFSSAGGQKPSRNVQASHPASSFRDEGLVEAFEPHRLVLLSSPESSDIDRNGLFE